jgi:aspartokinase/homoserine dehydrogenase 1
MGDSSSRIVATGNRTARRAHGRSPILDPVWSPVKPFEFGHQETSLSTPDRRRTERSAKRPLRIMKFGGTSLGSASCIANAAEIVCKASHESQIVVVVSAMSGVTNKLIDAARHAEAGNRERVECILEEIRQQHHAAAEALIHSRSEFDHVTHAMNQILVEGDHLCQGTILLRELTTRALDSISSLGERLCAPLVSTVLKERGIPSESIEATELIVIDSYHGSAEPRMGPIRERCEARLRPLLQQGVTPVITGFIGVTPEGIRTTLGRGGSDFSATILGATLDVDEVVIWTDVDGILTADPKLVPAARTISEISYLEATELAFFGARVLHPKTMRPVLRSSIPVRISNTFAPEKCGTKITAQGCSNGKGAKALTAIGEVALITVGGPEIVGVPEVLGRTFMTTAKLQVDVLLVSQSSSQSEICFVVPASAGTRTAEALRREFAQDLVHEEVEHITLNEEVAIVAVVGEKMRGTPGVVGRTFNALGRENVNIIAMAQGSSEASISFLVARKDMKAALMATHREFHLDQSNEVEASAIDT